MFFGCYHDDGNEMICSPYFENLQNIIAADILTSELIEFTSARIGFIRSIDEPFKADNFIYKDVSTGNHLVINGKIYNEKQLSEILGFEPGSLHIPELIYHAFEKWGPNFANQLNGDLSILLSIQTENTVYLYRDHLGIIPFAYTINDGVLYFSNDIVSLGRAFHQDEDRIQPEPLLKSFRMVDYNQSYNRNVQKLLPGHYLEFKSGVAKQVKFWLPEKIKTDRHLTKEKMLSEIKGLLERAVSVRCDNNRTVSSHMSGGLDSGIVAAIARRICSSQKEFLGYSWSPEGEWITDAGFDERQMVIDQALLCGITPKYASASEHDYNNLNYQRINNFGFFEEELALKDAKKNQVKIMLTGYGGDEFLSKGDRGIDTDLLLKLRFGKYFKRNPISKPRRLLYRLLYEVAFPFVGFLPFPVRKDAKLDTQYLLPEYKYTDKKIIKNFFMYRSRRQLHLGFIHCYYLPERMDSWYTNAFRHGIEYRYPLLDKDLVEYILKIPSHLLVNGRWSRTIIREISEGLLPESIRWRTSGLDPVSFRSARENVFACSKEYMDEVDQYRHNPDLQFIDFNKLEQDIGNYQKEGDDQKFIYLLYHLFHIKGLHEFTKAYRKMQEEIATDNKG